MIFVLVTPKLREVSTARSDLDQARNDQKTLESRIAVLTDAQEQAPKARRQIRRVNKQIPTVADQPGLILFLNNAATDAGLTLASFSPSTPAFDPTTGLSVIQVSVSASGTYFDITDFLYKIETFPRSAKVTSVALSGGEGGGGGVPELTLATTIEVYTSDTSAGPGSTPGATTEIPAGP